jgi:ATP synthase protein I
LLLSHDRIDPGFAQAFVPLFKAVDSPSELPKPASSTDSGDPAVADQPASDNSMSEFYQLRQELLTSTLILTGLIFGPVWYFYSLNIALNYLLGACTGVVYLRMLARNVERLGTEKQQLGKTQIAVFVGVMIFATQWEQLHVLPVFLGFLTFKAAIIVYTLRTAVMPR